MVVQDEPKDEKPDPLDGDPDPWSHGAWVAAWGRNAPLVVSPNDFRVPMPPPGMQWLLTRMLIGGTKVVDITLMRTVGDGPIVTVSHSRSVAEPESVIAKARLIMQQVLS
jgi:hypothetical protein